MTDPEFVPADDDARLDALKRYDILDTPQDGSFDRITALAARILGPRSPSSAWWIATGSGSSRAMA